MKVQSKKMTKGRKKKSSWNHRVMAHKDGDEVWFQVHEVYYTNGEPDSYTVEAAWAGGNSIKELMRDEQMIHDAIRNSQMAYFKKRNNQSIIWAGEKFPSEYNTAT